MCVSIFDVSPFNLYPQMIFFYLDSSYAILVLKKKKISHYIVVGFDRLNFVHMLYSVIMLKDSCIDE